MPVTARDVRMLADSQSETVRLVKRELSELWWQIQTLTPPQQRDALLDLIPALVRKYGDIGSTVAAEWYERMYAEHFDGETFTAETMNDYDDDALRRTIRWKAGMLFDANDKPADPDGMLRWLNQLLDREIKNPGRRTIRRNTTRDPHKPRWAARALRQPAVRVLCHARKPWLRVRKRGHRRLRRPVPRRRLPMRNHPGMGQRIQPHRRLRP
ncbi:hypothetical protein [Bifidobacterium bifidum]|uniref:VG15 protein n=1 Tax=Bifidobacterium bifidum TaxID=1681 RepID=UPI003D030473